MTRQEYNREISSHATCNWIEVRNQTAIAAMQSYISRNLGLSIEQVAKNSISYADELVKQLKGE